MLRELKRVAKISGMFLTFLVTFFAIYYHQSNRSDALQQTSEKPPYRTNREATTGSSDAIDMESNEAEDEKSSEENSEEIVDENKVKTTEDPIREYVEQRKKEREIYSRFSNLFAVLEDEEVQSNGKVRNKTDWDPSEIYLKNLFLQCMPLIGLLNLENKTQEQIRKELEVDFSTLDTNSLGKYDERMEAKVFLCLYRNILKLGKSRSAVEKLHPSDRKKYDLGKYNNGIVAVGVENFMKAATQFCEEEEAAEEVPIVSIGSGDGTVEMEIIAQYRERFGKDIRIQLVDPDPRFDGIVDFKTVDHLITENPRIVGNCVAFIFWPNPDEGASGELGYDIEAILKLQPRAVLTIYESAGASGSKDFRDFLYDDSLDIIPAVEFGARNWLSKIYLPKKQSYGLDNYAVLEVARQNVFLPYSGTLIYRMVKIMRSN